MQYAYRNGSSDKRRGSRATGLGFEGRPPCLISMFPNPESRWGEKKMTQWSPISEGGSTANRRAPTTDGGEADARAVPGLGPCRRRRDCRGGKPVRHRRRCRASSRTTLRCCVTWPANCVIDLFCSLGLPNSDPPPSRHIEPPFSVTGLAPLVARRRGGACSLVGQLDYELNST